MARDTAAAAAKSWPDDNYLFSRRWIEPPWPRPDSRWRGPGGGRGAIGRTDGNKGEDTTTSGAAQAAADALFGAGRP
jgi:hypothetical protein